MVWTCFTASRPERLALIDVTMNSEWYQANLKEYVRTTFQELNLMRKWVMQQDNNPKYTSRFTKEWLKKNKVNILGWSSQSLDLNPIEMFWKDLDLLAVHRRKATNIPELKWFCTEELAKYPSHCSGLISSYKKHLPAVIAEKESPTRFTAKIHMLMQCTVM